MKRTIVCALVLLAVATTSTRAEAWPAQVYRNMVFDTIRLLPPSLARVLWHRSDYILKGAQSLEGETASTIARDGLSGALSTELVGDVEARIARIVTMVDERSSFNDTAFELGRLLRIAADLSDPTVIAAGTPELKKVGLEYHRFVGLNADKVPLVHDKNLPSPLEAKGDGDADSVPLLLSRLSQASHRSVSPIYQAFWKDGRVLPAASFDFRSIPYGEFSLSYSRGVTAASYLWLSAWRRANGDFTGYRFSPEASQK